MVKRVQLPPEEPKEYAYPESQEDQDAHEDAGPICPSVDPSSTHYRRTIAIEARPIPGLDGIDGSPLQEFHAAGAPTEYFHKLDGMVTRLHMLGLSVKRICEIINIAEVTYYEWIKKHPTFANAVFNGTEGADMRVTASLFQRATGYSHTAEKVSINKDGDVFRAVYTEHYPPDTGAAQFWLTNRSNNRARMGKSLAWRNRVTEEVVDADDNVVDPSKPPQFIIQAVAAPPKKGEDK